MKFLKDEAFNEMLNKISTMEQSISALTAENKQFKESSPSVNEVSDLQTEVERLTSVNETLTTKATTLTTSNESLNTELSALKTKNTELTDENAKLKTLPGATTAIATGAASSEKDFTITNENLSFNENLLRIKTQLLPQLK